MDCILETMPRSAQVSWASVSHFSRSTLLDQPLTAEDGSTLAHFYFVDAPGGCGKTLLLKFLAAHLRSLGHGVVCSATTGIAALQYEGGLTMHSMFKLPLELDKDSTSHLSMMSERAEVLRNARLWIVDEVSMATALLFGCLIQLLEDLKPEHPIIVVCSGDFRQCPPVVKGGRKKDVLDISVKNNDVFRGSTVLHLTQNIRAQSDRDYSQMVSSVGNATAPEVLLPGCGDLPLVPLPLITAVKDLKELVEFVYPPGLSLYDAIKRAILSGTNANIDEINELILNGVPGAEIVLRSVDKLEGDHLKALPIGPDVLHSFNEVGVPPHVIILKTGSIAMVTRNVSFAAKLCNSLKVEYDLFPLAYRKRCRSSCGECGGGSSVWRCRPTTALPARFSRCPASTSDSRFLSSPPLRYHRPLFRPGRSPSLSCGTSSQSDSPTPTRLTKAKASRWTAPESTSP